MSSKHKKTRIRRINLTLNTMREMVRNWTKHKDNGIKVNWQFYTAVLYTMMLRFFFSQVSIAQL